MPIRWTLFAGALMCALAIGLGAFGAHALETRLTPDRLDLWRTAALYIMFSGLGALAAGILGRVGVVGTATAASPSSMPGLLLVVGGLIFGSTVAVLALGGPRWLGAVTPIGGALMIAGFLVLAWHLLRAPSGT